MCRCHSHQCDGCHGTVNRRHVLRGFGAVAAGTIGGLSSLSKAVANDKGRKVRVAAVFLAQVRDSWPYPGFDAAGRQREILAALRRGCPEVEFIPVTIQTSSDTAKAVGLKDQVDGYFVYVATLSWSLSGVPSVLAKLNKPMVVGNEFLGGCGAFLRSAPSLVNRNAAVAVSTTRLEDLVAVAQPFVSLGTAEVTPAEFARQCEKAYRNTFPPVSEDACADDRLKLTEISECLTRFRQSKVLVLGKGNGGKQRDMLGATWQYVDWNELEATYPEVDPDDVDAWAQRWSDRAEALPTSDYVEPSVPPEKEIKNAALVYLAMLRLLKKHDTNMITASCGGGLGTTGSLRGFPCLGFAQLLDDGGLGICEAHLDDTPPMLMARLLTGRPGFVSDPAIDTSQNRIVYSHCVGPTKVFGPDGERNDFHIRTSHARVGAVVESLMPAGYMTTTFRTNIARRQMILHQAKSLGPLASEKGCRTKLIGEVRGDIGKMFDRWNQFGWHRVTVYGDVKEPLIEFGKALGLEVIEEA